MTSPAASLPPVWHLAPPSGWMNDPNGLVVADGRWHAYFQHHPFDDRWGPMHWGHASSADGLRWEHHPIALRPDELGTIFSGSIVVDRDDVAGFGTGAWLAFFTHHTDTRQSQSVAWSTDGGTTWTKYAGNPVLPGEVADFRDPKVCRLPDGRWCMVVSFADHLAFYASDDLLQWDRIGEFRDDLGPGVGNWECPDLVPLADGRWLLMVSLSTGGVQGHSGTVVLVGEFSDGTFVADGAPQRLDHGPDCYAWQTFHGTPADEILGMAWANSWAVAHEVPSAGRRGVMTLPRRLWLDAAGNVWQWPAVDPPQDEGGAMWIDAEGDVAVRVEANGGTDGAVSVRVHDGMVTVERSGTVAAGFDGRFTAPVREPGPSLVVVDHGLVEVFAGGGSVAITAQAVLGPAPVVMRR